jgi:hypothetical protein
MKKRLFRPLKSPKSELKVRHRPFLSFDSRLSLFTNEKAVKIGLLGLRIRLKASKAMLTCLNSCVWQTRQGKAAGSGLATKM